MEPITTAFATIVSLLADYKSSQATREAADLDQYLEWVRRKDHKELADQISQNIDLSNWIKGQLQQQHEQVIAKLHKLDKRLSAIASTFSEYRLVAAAVYPGVALAEQPKSFLKQMRTANASFIIEHVTNTRTTFSMFTGTKQRCGELTVPDPTFLKDDLDTLCELGLLRYEPCGNARQFNITRLGAMVGDST